MCLILFAMGVGSERKKKLLSVNWCVEIVTLFAPINDCVWCSLVNILVWGTSDRGFKSRRADSGCKSAW